jgi:hypothetical protein
VTQTRSCSAVLYFAFTTFFKLDRNISSGSKYHKAPQGIFKHDPIPSLPILYTGTCHSPFIPNVCFPNYITGTICHIKNFESFFLIPFRRRKNIKFYLGVCHDFRFSVCTHIHTYICKYICTYIYIMFC